MAHEDEKPFLIIEVVKLEDPNRNEKKILEEIKKRSDKNNPFEAEWIEMESHPKLRFVYPSIKAFEEAFQRGLDILDALLENIQQKRVDFKKMLALSDSENKSIDNQKIYLIVKYTTNYKKPLRSNYEYMQWFANYFHEMIRHEEVVDGFLHFYKWEIDFENSNLDKLDPKELRIWIKHKNPKISEEGIQQLLTFLPSKKLGSTFA